MNDKNKIINIRSCAEEHKFMCWNNLWLFLFIAGFGVFFIGMPKFMDDYWYMMHLRPWFESQGIVYPENGGNIFKAGIPWQAIWDTWNEHYEIDNIRLGNLIAPILLLFPKWVGSGLCFLCWGYAVAGALRMAGIDLRKSPLVPIAIFLWTFFMPWRNHFGCLDFQLNYIVPTALAIRLVNYLRKDTFPYGLQSFINVVLLSILLGLWHESISVSTICGLVALSAIHKKFRNCFVYLSILILASGTAVLLSVPGMQIRMGSLYLHRQFVVKSLLDFYAMEGWPFFLMLLFIIINITARKTGKLFKSIPFVFSFVTAMVSAIISFYTGANERACFFMAFMASLCIVYQLKIMMPAFTFKYNKLNIILSGLLLSATFVHLAYVDSYVLRYRLIMKNMIESYVGNPKESYFCDIKTLRHMPLICGYLPDTWFCGMYLPWYYNNNKISRWTGEEWCIPKELEYVDENTGTDISGGRGIRIAEGYIYAPEDICDDPQRTINIDFGKGFVPVYAVLTRFKSAADGRYYVFIMPFTDWYVSHFKNIKAIHF